VLIHPYIINEIHRGILRVSVIVICLDAVKIYGKSPRKLFIRMKVRRPINNRDLPFIEFSPKRFLNSKCNFFIKKFTKIIILLGGAQNIGVKINIIIIDLIQFIDKKIDDVGSNTEKRLVIIFNLLN